MTRFELFNLDTAITNCFSLIFRLSGRLDLLVNQIKQNTDHDIVEDSDLLVYEDKGNKKN